MSHKCRPEKFHLGEDWLLLHGGIMHVNDISVGNWTAGAQK